MLLIPALLLAIQAPDIASLDALAQKRDVAAITKFLTPESLQPMNPIQVMKTNGAYDVGSKGWHAVELVTPDKKDTYVVFTTPLTTEDIGELVFRRQGAALKYVPEDNALGFQILRHRFDVSFDIPNKGVRIEDAMTVQETTMGAAVRSALFRMSPYLHVDSVKAAGKDLLFVQAGGTTAVSLSSLRSDTATYSLTMTYHGVCDLPQYAGSINDGEAQLTNDYWYPMIARWPAPYDITVHTPKGWLAIGQGEQVAMTEDDKGRTTKYRMDLPVTYYSLSAAPYKTASQQDGKRKMSAWSLTRTPEQLQLQTELYKPIFAFYDKNFAPFPFSGFGALHSELYGGGALEAYSYATYGFGVPDEDAHEPSHTWWGGMIDNTYLHSMWNESFADFCEGLYRRNVPIGNPNERKTAFVQDAKPNQAYLTAPCETASPWYGGDASSIGYGKGAKVLQMLETELGTEMMIKTMQLWLKEHPKGSAGEWSGYEKAVADATHKDYKWFFDQWIRRTGWARFEVKNVKWVQGLLTGEIRFTGQPYKIHCELMLQYADGGQDFTKFDTMQEKVGDHYVFVIKAPKHPVLVSVDPWRRVLRDTHDDEAPVSIETAMQNVRRYHDPKHADWVKGMGGMLLNAMPKDLANTFIVGTPDTIPEMALLCGKAGFRVRGDQLTYNETTIDLKNGGAVAVVDLPDGKHCVIGLGTFKVEPKFGRARTALFDRFGRFLRGKTEPKTAGWMTFKLPPPGRKLNPNGGPIK